MANQEVYRGSFDGADPDNFNPDYDTGGGEQQVEFYFNPVAEKDYCRMLFPGNKLTVWDQPVREVDKQRFFRQWSLYKEGKDQLGGKTLLNTWGEIDPGSIEEYRGMHIQTVEALASLPDVNITQFPPGLQHLAHRHRDMARAYLKRKQQSAGFDQALEAAQQSQDVAQQALEENAALKAQLDELQRRLADPAPATPDNESWPRLHKRKPGGWLYELSNGDIVSGKEQAQLAQSALDEVA